MCRVELPYFPRLRDILLGRMEKVCKTKGAKMNMLAMAVILPIPVRGRPPWLAWRVRRRHAAFLPAGRANERTNERRMNYASLARSVPRRVKSIHADSHLAAAAAVAAASANFISRPLRTNFLVAFNLRPFSFMRNLCCFSCRHSKVLFLQIWG